MQLHQQKKESRQCGNTDGKCDNEYRRKDKVNITHMDIKRKKLDESNYEKIITNHAFGMKTSQISEVCGFGDDTVKRVIRAFEIVKNQNWEDALQYAKTGYSIRYLEWAAKRMMVELPENVIFAYELKMADTAAAQRERERNKKLKEPEEKEEEQPEEQIEEKPVPQKQNENLYLCKVLEALAKTNELLEQFMDVVIPKHMIDLKDNINANSDIIAERIKNCEDKIEKVVYNTRKRGA